MNPLEADEFRSRSLSMLIGRLDSILRESGRMWNRAKALAAALRSQPVHLSQVVWWRQVDTWGEGLL
jgi:hypothetical protein